MRNRKLLLALALTLFLPFSLFSEEWVIPRTTYYITADQQKFPDFPAPPAAGSKADLVPSGKKAFLPRADQAGLDRVIGGVHHPSDIEAGKKLADKLFSAYKKKPALPRGHGNLADHARKGRGCEMTDRAAAPTWPRGNYGR